MTAASQAIPAPDGDGLPRGLPAWAYADARLTKLEHERVLMPSWQIACHVQSIPAPGDYMTFDIGPDSVVVLRYQAGDIHAFHNACRHRGARLVDGHGKCPGAITCPYHGWTYDLDGSLRGLPVRDSFPGLDRAAYGLKPVRTEIMLGFVFVCLTGDPAPLKEQWREFLPDFAPYRFDEMMPLGAIYFEEWDVDWKVAMDNYLESYHVRPSTNWSERNYQEMVGTVNADLPEANKRSWRFYSMLPNLGIDVFPDQMDFFQVLPNGPGKCIIRGGNFGLPDRRREMGLVRYLNNRINRQVQREDEFLCRRIQRGITSSSYSPGPLSEIEACMLQFHDLLQDRIPAIRAPTRPAVIV